MNKKDQWATKELELLSGNTLSPKMYSFDEVKKLLAAKDQEIKETYDMLKAHEEEEIKQAKEEVVGIIDKQYQKEKGIHNWLDLKSKLLLKNKGL